MSSSSGARGIEPRAEDSPVREQLSSDEKSQIAARLRLAPAERLRYLEDMIEFEEQAKRARRVTSH
jgi:hypothetical protein